MASVRKGFSWVEGCSPPYKETTELTDGLGDDWYPETSITRQHPREGTGRGYSLFVL